MDKAIETIYILKLSKNYLVGPDGFPVYFTSWDTEELAKKMITKYRVRNLE